MREQEPSQRMQEEEAKDSFQWNRLGQYHSMVKHKGGHTLLQRKRGELGVYNSLTFHNEGEINWLLNFFPLDGQEKSDWTYTHSGAILDIEITPDSSVTLTIRHSEEQAIQMERHEFLQVLLLANELEAKKQSIRTRVQLPLQRAELGRAEKQLSNCTTQNNDSVGPFFSH